MNVEKLKESLYLTGIKEAELQRYLNASEVKVNNAMEDIKFYLACYDIVSKIGSEREMEFYKKKILAKLEIV